MIYPQGDNGRHDVSDLVYLPVHTQQDVHQMMGTAEGNRTIARTDMNERSSRRWVRAHTAPTHARTNARTQTHARTHARTHAHAHTNKQTNTRTQRNARAWTVLNEQRAWFIPSIRMVSAPATHPHKHLRAAAAATRSSPCGSRGRGSSPGRPRPCTGPCTSSTWPDPSASASPAPPASE